MPKVYILEESDKALLTDAAALLKKIVHSEKLRKRIEFSERIVVLRPAMSQNGAFGYLVPRYKGLKQRCPGSSH